MNKKIMRINLIKSIDLLYDKEYIGYLQHDSILNKIEEDYKKVEK